MSDNHPTRTKVARHCPDIAVIIRTHDEDDIIADVLGEYARYTNRIFVVDTGPGAGTGEACRASPVVARYERCSGPGEIHDALNRSITAAKERIREDGWLFLVEGDEIPCDDLREIAARATSEDSRTIVFRIADYYLTLGEAAACSAEDDSRHVWERRLFYSIHSAAPRACRILPGLRCGFGSLFPRESETGDPLNKPASFQPIIKKYAFRSLDQLRRKQKPIFMGMCDAVLPRNATLKWYDFLVDERLLQKGTTPVEGRGKDLPTLIQETRRLRAARLSTVTKELDCEKGPLVSVIVPTFNRAHLLERALQSVLSQTYKNMEIIVVDDGSNDGTLDRVSGLADRRLIYVRRSSNSAGRPGIVRNEGVRVARGDYIAYLDDDEIWEPQHVGRLAEVLASWPWVGMAYCDSLVGGTSSRTGDHSDNEDMLNYDHIRSSEVVHKANCLSKTGAWNSYLQWGSCSEFCLRFSEEHEVVHLPLVLTHAPIRKDQELPPAQEVQTIQQAIRRVSSSGLPLTKRDSYFRAVLGYVEPVHEDGREANNAAVRDSEKRSAMRWSWGSAREDPRVVVALFSMRCLVQFSQSGPTLILSCGSDRMTDAGQELSPSPDVHFCRVDSVAEIREKVLGQYALVIVPEVLSGPTGIIHSLHELRRLLKPGGQLCFAHPFDPRSATMGASVAVATPLSVKRLLEPLFAEVDIEVVGPPGSPTLGLCTATTFGGTPAFSMPSLDAVFCCSEVTRALERWLDNIGPVLPRGSRRIVVLNTVLSEARAFLSHRPTRYTHAIVAPSDPELTALERGIGCSFSDVVVVIQADECLVQLPDHWTNACNQAFRADPGLGCIFASSGITATDAKKGSDRTGNGVPPPLIQVVRRSACPQEALTEWSLKSVTEARGFKVRRLKDVVPLFEV